jgi:drug/metabolite transporter (DMT)-like permease
VGPAVPLNQYLFLRGVRHTTPGHPALLYALTPACVLLITSAGQRRLPRPQRLAGVLLALAGVLLLLRPWQRTDLVTAWRTGDLWILAAVLAWALYTVLARELCRAHSSVLVTSLSILLGTALFLPLGASRLLAADLARVPLSAWAGLLWLAAVTSVLMMFLWNRLLKTLDAVQLTICMNAQPLATAGLSAALAALGVLAEKQDLGAVFWTGTLLVLVGVWLVQTAAPPARRIAPAPMELPG